MIKSLIRKFGFDVVRYPYRFGQNDLRKSLKANAVRLLHSHNVDLLLDVGANTGQYASGIRNSGYVEKIISFEPLEQAFVQLAERARLDSNWDVHNFAVGNFNGHSTINVSENLVSSSILDMEKMHTQSEPTSKYIGTQKIEVKTLDLLFPQFEKFNNIFLKIDVQGFEKQVLEGAGNNLDRVVGIQTEMSLVRLYEGELLFFDYCQLLTSYGYTLMSIEPGFFDAETGQMLQVDGVWYRK